MRGKYDRTPLNDWNHWNIRNEWYALLLGEKMELLKASIQPPAAQGYSRYRAEFNCFGPDEKTQAHRPTARASTTSSTAAARRCSMAKISIERRHVYRAIVGMARACERLVGRRTFSLLNAR